MSSQNALTIRWWLMMCWLLSSSVLLYYIRQFSPFSWTSWIEWLATQHSSRLHFNIFKVAKYGLVCGFLDVASRHLFDRWTKCVSWFWAAYCCFKSHQEVYPTCKEDCICGGAWFYNGNIPGWQSYCVRGTAFCGLYSKFSSVIVDRDESLLICKSSILIPILHALRRQKVKKDENINEETKSL